MSVPNPGLPRGLRSRLAVGALALLTAVTGLVMVPLPDAPAEAAVLPNDFKSVGYLPSWAGDVNSIQYEKLTHINYAFVVPGADGTITGVANPAKLQSLVSQAHANDVKVLISIGGWNGGDDSGFESMAADATTRTTFVTNTVNLIDQYNLDGVDIDWEYPNPGTSGDNFTLLMRELSIAMHGRGKLLTAAVVSGGTTANGVQPAVFDHVDFLNIMLYDGGSPHANYDWAISNLNEWKSRGLPASKAVLGVPFYSRPASYTFARLEAMDPANADRDCTTVNGGQACYNGRPTIRRKTQWAMANAGGMMNWELGQDTNNATSLVSVIYETVKAGGGPTPPPSGRVGQITGIAGKCVDVFWGRTANGTAVQIYACNGNDAQRWTVGSDDTLRALDKCMDVTNGSTANGAKVQLWDCNGTDAQVWQTQSDGTLRNPQASKCLKTTGGSSADGTLLEIRNCVGGANQRWQLP